MGHRLRIVLAAIVAAGVLGVVAGTASGYVATSISPGGSIRAVSLTSLNFETEAITVRCPVTLEGTMESAELPIEGSEIGAVTRAGIGSCTNGTLRSVLGLNWYLIDNSFLGTLPSVTGYLLTIEEAALNYSVTVLGIPVECLYVGNVEMLLAVNARQESELIRSLANSIPLERARSSELCPASGRLVGSLSLTPQQRLPAATQGYAMQPERPTVRFHRPARNEHTFTFTNTLRIAVTVSSAFMEKGTNFSVDPEDCNGTIQPGRTCDVLVRKNGTPTTFDVVILGMESGRTAGIAYVYP